MLNLSDKELDRLSREAAQEHDPGDVLGSRSWEKLEPRLDRDLGRSGPNPLRGVRRFPFYYVPAILLVAGVFYFVKQSHNSKQNAPSGSPPSVTVQSTPATETQSLSSTQNPEHSSNSTPPATPSAAANPPIANSATTDPAATNPAGTNPANTNPAGTNSAVPDHTTPATANTPATYPAGANAAATNSAGTNPATANPATPDAKLSLPAHAATASSTLAATTTPDNSATTPSTPTNKTTHYPGTTAANTANTTNTTNGTTTATINTTTAILTHNTHTNKRHKGKNTLTTSGANTTGANLTTNNKDKTNNNIIATVGTTFPNGTATTISATATGANNSVNNIPNKNNTANNNNKPRELTLSPTHSPRSLKQQPTISDSALRAYAAKESRSLIQPGKNKSLRIKRNLQFGLSFAPDFSSVNSLAGDKPGSSFGLTVDYQFANRLYLSTGLLLDRKNYAARQQDYHVSSDWYRMNNLHNVDFVKGSFNMLEIPLNLRYDFSVAGSTLFFASAGFSSYLLTKENCNYYYNWYGREDAKSFSYPNKNNYLFSCINLSLGVETGLSNSLSMLIAPYVKIPSRNIGFGQVQMNSVGINFALKFAPVTSRKRK